MTREEWLVLAAGRLAPWLEAVGGPVPPKVRYSCGFPVGGLRKIGQCWSMHASRDEHFEIFVSPVLDEGPEVLRVVLHEMIHAAAPGCGHRGKFRQFALAVGFNKPMKTTPAAPDLWKRLNALAADLPVYPHGAIDAEKLGRKKQSTRMRKLVCPDCCYVVRTTAKWVAVGLPTCCCGAEFIEAAADEADGE